MTERRPGPGDGSNQKVCSGWGRAGRRGWTGCLLPRNSSAVNQHCGRKQREDEVKGSLQNRSSDPSQHPDSAPGSHILHLTPLSLCVSVNVSSFLGSSEDRAIHRSTQGSGKSAGPRGFSHKLASFLRRKTPHLEAEGTC